MTGAPADTALTLVLTFAAPPASRTRMPQTHPPANPSPARRASAPALHRVGSVEELEAQVGRHLVRSRRQGDLLALLWIEVDLLVHGDPTLGGSSHEAVAQALGARLRHRVRRTDHVIQVGTTGFAALLNTDMAGARLVRQRLMAELHGPYGMDGGLVHAHLLVGLAASSEARPPGRSLLRQAMDDVAGGSSPAAAYSA